MKLQFSLATLLVCICVAGVVLSYCVNIPVVEPWDSNPTGPHLVEFAHVPTWRDVATRFLYFGPPSIVATLVVLWAIRRLKSRRENGPPVG